VTTLVRRAAVAALALVATFVAPLTAPLFAEEPMPLVQTRGAATLADAPQTSAGADLFAPSQIADLVYPVRDERLTPAVDTADPATLRETMHDAVAANDQPRFDAALARAKSVVETLPLGDERNSLRRAILVYSDIQQVWSYAAADRFGAFYDDESLPGIHDKLAADYPGYDDFISQYRVTDAAGRTLYATGETRAFLLKSAGGGWQVAHTRRREREQVTSPAPVTTARVTHVRIEKAALTPPPAVVTRPSTVVTPAIQAPATNVAQQKPADALAADIARAAKPELSPAVVDAQPVEASALTGGRTSGMLFIIVGLVAIGVMSLWARTPQVTPQPLMPPAETAAPKVIEPAAAEVAVKTKRTARRATGSR
jgi:hypothetical protein